MIAAYSAHISIYTSALVSSLLLNIAFFFSILLEAGMDHRSTEANATPSEIFILVSKVFQAIKSKIRTSSGSGILQYVDSIKEVAFNTDMSMTAGPRVALTMFGCCGLRPHPLNWPALLIASSARGSGNQLLSILANVSQR